MEQFIMYHIIKFKNKLAESLTENQRKKVRKVIKVFFSALSSKSNLEMLALKHGTGKMDHGYMKHYESHFAPLRKKRLKILEIGVAKGCSVRMWQEYFPNSMIFAIDIENKKKHEEDRIKTFQGSQSKRSCVSKSSRPKNWKI